MSGNAREAILKAARRAAQSHGYGGLNFRELAAEIGIKGASIHYHFPTKADLGAAVARRYWEDSAAVLEALWDDAPDAVGWLRRYPDTFRRSLENGNGICLCSFMSAEYDDLPEPVQKEVLAFADVNVAWLTKALLAATGLTPEEGKARARAIFASVAGAQLMARSRSDIAVFDSLIDSYLAAGLLPS